MPVVSEISETADKNSLLGVKERCARSSKHGRRTRRACKIVGCHSRRELRNMIVIAYPESNHAA